VLNDGDRHFGDHRHSQGRAKAIGLLMKLAGAAVCRLGDCFSYALAKDTGEPLLFKGNDFSQNDIMPAV
jgi:uncharacterized protein with PIN domain